MNNESSNNPNTSVNSQGNSLTGVSASTSSSVSVPSNARGDANISSSTNVSSFGNTPQENEVLEPNAPNAQDAEILDESPTIEILTTGLTQQIPVVSPDALTPQIEELKEESDGESPKIQTRYNPVTGEEMSMEELLGKGKKDEGSSVKVEKVKKVDVEYRPASTGNTIMLVLFFIFLILFVVFLPDIQSLIASYRAGDSEKVEEITTGKVVCTLESNTVNLDKEIKRVFNYTDMKLQTAKFTTTTRGDATLDEEALDELNEQCVEVRENVQGLAGISVSCDYKNGKLVESETFDYTAYNAEEVSAAYAKAGGSVLDLEKDQDIDLVITQMRRSGFTCNKEK